MHLVANCNSCGSDWCEAVKKGECVKFDFDDGKHILGPNTLKMGCDALASRAPYYRTPFCIAGSTEIYAVAKRAPPTTSKAVGFDAASCVSTSPAADNAWCKAFCKTPNCLSSSGMCECGRTGTKGRRRTQPQPEGNDDDRYVSVVPASLREHHVHG